MTFEILCGRHDRHDRGLQQLIELVLSLHHKVDTLMTDQNQLIARLNAMDTKIGNINTGLQKAATDIQALRATLANQGSLTPEAEAALSSVETHLDGLSTEAQTVDDAAAGTQTPAPTPAPTA